MAAIEQVTEILRTRGEGLRLADLDEIERLLLDVPPERSAESFAWAYEAIGLIVNAPEYSGDIPPERLN